jgi:DNA-binding transcriptional LysR family regulator
MRRTTFDLDALRSFVAGVDLGAFTRAADLLGRSTSAVSAQLKKLEQQAGTAIFRRSGRGLALTEAGEVVLGYGRRLIALNDEAAGALQGMTLEGWVRVGVQEDFGEVLLPRALGRFARTHRKVKVEARVGRSADLAARLAAGELDFALVWGDGTPSDGERLAALPMRWIGPPDSEPGWSRSSGEPLPLVAFEAPCLCRSAAIAALDRAGIPWRIAFVSASLAGLWAAVEAGVGITVRTEIGLPSRVRVLDEGASLPHISPDLTVSLHRARSHLDAATERLVEIVRQAVDETARAVLAQPRRRNARLQPYRRPGADDSEIAKSLSTQAAPPKQPHRLKIDPGLL